MQISLLLTSIENVFKTKQRLISLTNPSNGFNGFLKKKLPSLHAVSLTLPNLKGFNELTVFFSFNHFVEKMVYLIEATAYGLINVTLLSCSVTDWLNK